MADRVPNKFLSPSFSAMNTKTNNAFSNDKAG